MIYRAARLATFALTMALSATTFGLASWGLKQGLDKQKLTQATLPGATLHIQDALGSGGAVTAASAIASLVCLYMCFLLFFRRHSVETLKSVRIKEGMFLFAALFWLATLIPATVICATRSGVVTKEGLSPAIIAQLVALSGQNLAYHSQTPIKAYVIVGWFAFASTVANLILVSMAARYVLKHGQQDMNGNLVDGHDNHTLARTNSSPAATMKTTAESVRHPTAVNEKVVDEKIEHVHGAEQHV